MRVLLNPNFDKTNADICTTAVIRRLRHLGCEIVMDQDRRETTVQRVESIEDVSFEDLHIASHSCDVIVAIGGDGTILHSAKYAVEGDKPLIGVNVGRLGFLATVEMGELDLFDRIVAGDYRIEQRMMLEVKKYGPGSQTHRFLALNDAVIARANSSTVAELILCCNEKEISRYRADGLIVATPTGSTAYAFSAGGPTIDPAISSIAVTPVCPHSLFARTMVFPDDRSLRVLRGSTGDICLTVDGESTVMVESHEIVEITRAPVTLKLIAFEEQSFYDTLNKKMIGRYAH